MSEAPGGVERRLALRLLEHWRDAEAELGRMPTLDAMAGRDLDADIHAGLFILRLRKDAPPLVETIGAALVQDLDDDLRGSPATEIPQSSLLYHALTFHDRVVGKKVPVSRGGEYENADGETVAFRSILLPIAGRSGRLAFVMGAANCTVRNPTAEETAD